MLSTYEQRSRAKLAVTIVTILVIAGVVLLADRFKNNKSTDPSEVVAQTGTSTPATSTPSTTDNDSTASSDASTASGRYKDGTYSASDSYFVPHGQENIAVNLTLKGGAITDVSIQNSESDFDSAQYQEEFAAQYKSQVVGQKISGLQLSNIAGASDTTQAFNDALQQIASKAQA